MVGVYPVGGLKYISVKEVHKIYLKYKFDFFLWGGGGDVFIIFVAYMLLDAIEEAIWNFLGFIGSQLDKKTLNWRLKNEPTLKIMEKFKTKFSEWKSSVKSLSLYL